MFKCEGNIRNAAIGAALLLFAPVMAQAQSGPEKAVLMFQNLAPLNEGIDGHYQGWAVLNGAPVSTGIFNVNADGYPVALGGGSVITQFDAGCDISAATEFFVTVESAEDSEPSPSPVILLRGPVIGRSGVLRVDVPGLDDLPDATGSFALLTPSDGVSTEEAGGIWFTDRTGTGATLVGLPEPGPQWTYEGWVVDRQQLAARIITEGGGGGTPAPIYLTTGQFRNVQGEDLSGAGCRRQGIQFPGQEFTIHQCGTGILLDSGDYDVFITLEPEGDLNPSPFQLRVFASSISTTALWTDNPLENLVGSGFPSGSIQIYDGPVSTEQTTWGRVKSGQ